MGQNKKICCWAQAVQGASAVERQHVQTLQTSRGREILPPVICITMSSPVIHTATPPQVFKIKKALIWDFFSAWFLVNSSCGPVYRTGLSVNMKEWHDRGQRQGGTDLPGTGNLVVRAWLCTRRYCTVKSVNARVYMHLERLMSDKGVILWVGASSDNLYLHSLASSCAAMRGLPGCMDALTKVHYVCCFFKEKPTEYREGVWKRLHEDFWILI